MRLITLTSMTSGYKIHINVDQIGHIYESKDKYSGIQLEEKGCTIVGVTTHNNGGFKVTEKPDTIFELIKESKEL